MDHSDLLAASTTNPIHSCRHCPLLDVQVGDDDSGIVSTRTLPSWQVLILARDGCEFFVERLKQLRRPFSAVFWDVANSRFDLSLAILGDGSLQISTSLSAGICVVDCEWQIYDEPLLDCVEKSLLGYDIS